MLRDDESFESALQRDLERLGRLAGGGRVDHQTVMKRLKSRSRRRSIAGAAVAASVLAAGACWMAIHAPYRTVRQPPRTLAGCTVEQAASQSHHVESGRPIVSALPVNAGRADILEGLARLGLTGGNLLITKTDQGDVSFVTSGAVALPPERIRRELETMFRDFTYVDLNRSNNSLSYLIVAGPAGEARPPAIERNIQ